MHTSRLVLALVAPLFLPAQQPEKSPWDSMKFFVGRWQGTQQGEPGNGKGEREYEWVLRGKALQLKNRSTYPPQEKNPKGEVHEDLSFYTYDTQRKRVVLRQFHVEGFVNQYIQQESPAEGKTLVFVTERIENIPEGWRARETYKIVSQDEYTEVFELAEPGKDFAIYTQSHWKRSTHKSVAKKPK